MPDRLTDRDRRARRHEARRREGRRRFAWIGLLAVAGAAVAAVALGVGQGGDSPPPASTPAAAAAAADGDRRDIAQTDAAASPAPAPPPGQTAEGLLTFRGDRTRTYYGRGPVPRAPKVLWRYPSSGGMCSQSSENNTSVTWCGVGWTGQPNVVPLKNGPAELRFGAYDAAYHFLNARTGRERRADLQTGDLAKGSATSDPDGYPLYYAGSRDNQFRIVALDRGDPKVLWSIDGQTSVPAIWNNDWDGAALVVDGHLLVGGENSWFYVIRLNRRYGAGGKVTVNPVVVATVPGYDDDLRASLPDDKLSIENSVAYRDGVAYFANSGGLVQGWDVSKALKGRGGSTVKRVFRYWAGDDVDASIVIDEEGFLYVASELERNTSRSLEVGQLLKLDPRKPGAPRVWGVPVQERGAQGAGGIWATPALHRDVLLVPTNAGELLAVDRAKGRVRWRIDLPGPTWSSPVVIDDVLLQGDCNGALHAYDVSQTATRPKELWKVSLGGCIEATPAVWDGRIYIGTRGGAMYALGDRR